MSEKIITRVENPTPAAPVLKRVAAYARVSLESERLMHSLSAQVSYYSELIQKTPGWIYAGVYADEFISGTSIRHRAEFQRLMDDCDKGLIDIVLCKSISRFARNTVDLLSSVRRLKEIGVEIRFEKENVSNMTADGELMMTLLAVFSQEESRSISDNIKWAIQKKFERGETWHTAPFGYRWNGETFLVQNEEADVVRRIYADFLADVPLGRIAGWMKDEGWPGANVTTVEYILTNITYTGDVITQKYFTADPLTHEQVKNEGQLPRHYIAENHTAIIPKETYEAVQSKVKASYDFNKEAHRFTMPSCFSAKLVCPHCGSNYVKGLVKTNKHDGLQESWRCMGKIKNGASSCPSINIKGEELREACRIALGLKEFDEDLFSRTVRRIMLIDGDLLEFRFYDGTVRTAPVRYFDQSKKKRTDPHTTFFGYQWSKDGYVVIPEQAEAIRLMYRLYADGMTISDIRRTVEAKGYRSFRGSVSNKLIAKALDSNLYIGERTVRGRFTQSGQNEIIENDHEAVVSTELNDAVKARRVTELKKQERRLATNKAKKEAQHGKDSNAHTADT